MKLNDAMDEVATALSAVTGLRITAHPVESIVPPAGAIGYPESIDYDQTYGRGTDQINSLPVACYVGKATSRAARNTAAAWADGTGPTSVKAAIERHTYTSCDNVTVTRAEFSIESVAGVDYVQVLFLLDIIGGGS